MTFSSRTFDRLKHHSLAVRLAALALAAGLMVRLEDAMRPLLITAVAAIAAISLVMLGYAAAAVSEGFLGLHKHWWSTAPAATFALCMLALIMLAKRRAHLTRV